MNNTIILENCISQFKNSNELEHLSDHDVFALFAMLQITKDFDPTNSDIDESMVDGEQDGGIDSIIISVNDQFISTSNELEDISFTSHTNVQIVISQLKFQNSFAESVLDKLHISVVHLLNLELDENALLRRFNPKLVDKAMLLREVWFACTSNGGTLSITFVYATKANEISGNSAFQSKEEQLVDVTKDMTNQGNVEFLKFSSKEIMELYQRPQKTTLDLKFKENPTPVQFLDKEYGYVGVVSLKDYYNFIVSEERRIKEQIFESNVRHFQGNVDVNRKIQDTLRSDFSRDFWWLNNGITIIASDCRTIGKALYLEGVQIVNGLQTSFLVANHYDRDNAEDSRAILVKVVVTKDRETIDKIISASNSQTPVSPSILRATEDIQRRLELYFASQGYWYDRRKNYYKNLGKPTRRIFNIQGTAQAIEAVLHGNPSAARSTPTGLVKSDKSYARIFDPNTDFKAYLNCSLLHQKVTDFIKTMPKDDKNKARNFSYHLARILASIATQVASPACSDMAAIDVDSAHVEGAYALFLALLKKYQVSNPDENIINIAKSKKFADELNGGLERQFPTL
jgi:hypothetical protein